MASGSPIVGYRHGGICEMVKEGENGMLAEVKNPMDLSKQIKTLLSDHNKRNIMGKNSVKRQKNLFSLESYTKNISKLYE